MDKRFLDVLEKHFFTRKIDLNTGKPFRDIALEMEFYTLIKKENKRIIDTITASSAQYFHVLTYMEQDSGSFINYKNYDAIKKVSCLFPNKLIVTTPFKQECSDMLFILYYKCRELIKNNLLEFYIDLIERDSTWQPVPGEISSPDTIKNKDDIYILTEDYQSVNFDGKIQVMLPWLQNARAEDYVELINKYKVQYEVYAHHIDKIAGVAMNAEELTSLLIKETKDAFIDIQIALEKKSDELKKKGIATTVGSILTAIPMLIPSDFANISPDLLSGLLGATTLVGTVPPLIDKIIDKHNVSKDNPYWLLWKWKCISK